MRVWRDYRYYGHKSFYFCSGRRSFAAEATESELKTHLHLVKRNSTTVEEPENDRKEQSSCSTLTGFMLQPSFIVIKEGNMIFRFFFR